ncbi:MAG TPA: hypothetical protein GXZ48_06875 [Acholeplasmataceae bacterium]|nr:hypothetical protein [Acholeplasmataceae bacterium]
MIKNFIKSLIFPSYMVRYKSMNLFFAIAIFFISSFILALPQMYYTSEKRYQVVDIDAPFELEAFNNLSDEAIAKIRSLGVRIEDGAIKDQGNVEEYKLYEFTSDDYAVFLAFDFYDITDEKETFNKEIFENFHEIDFDGTKVLVVFYLTECVYLLPSGSNDLDYGKIKLDFSTINNGKDLSYRFMDMFIPIIYRRITLDTFLNCVIYTLIIMLLLWLFLKSEGTTFGFKEYYNIGAIASIIPLLLVFIFSWIFPRLTLMHYFTVVFGIYYLIMIVRINSKTKIA